MPRNPAHLLRSFLKRRGITQPSFGRRIGVSGTSVYKYLSGGCIPSEAVRVAIERETDGAVPAGLWPMTDRRNGTVL